MSSSGITGFNILRRNGEMIGLQCVYCKTIGGFISFTHSPDCTMKPIYQPMRMPQDGNNEPRKTGGLKLTEKDKQ